MSFSIIISFIGLLFLSAFFSSSETAYFNLRKHRKNFSNKVSNIINDPEKLKYINNEYLILKEQLDKNINNDEKLNKLFN